LLVVYIGIQTIRCHSKSLQLSASQILSNTNAHLGHVLFGSKLNSSRWMTEKGHIVVQRIVGVIVEWISCRDGGFELVRRIRIFFVVSSRIIKTRFRLPILKGNISSRRLLLVLVFLFRRQRIVFLLHRTHNHKVFNQTAIRNLGGLFGGGHVGVDCCFLLLLPLHLQRRQKPVIKAKNTPAGCPRRLGANEQSERKILRSLFGSVLPQCFREGIPMRQWFSFTLLAPSCEEEDAAEREVRRRRAVRRAIYSWPWSGGRGLCVLRRSHCE